MIRDVALSSALELVGYAIVAAIILAPWVYMFYLAWGGA